MAAKYTYFLDFGSGEVEIIPDKDVVYEWKKDGQERGFMRKGIKGLTFTKDFDNQGTLTNVTPFNTLWEWYFDLTKHTTEITLSIYKNTVLDLETVFYVQNGSIDINNGVYTIKPTPDDAYRILLSVIENDVNIITGASPYNAVLTYTATIEGFDNGSSTTSPAITHTMFPDVWVLGTGVGCTTWYRQISAYDLGTGWTKYGENGEGVYGIIYGALWYKGISRSCDNSSGTDPEEKITTFPNCYYLTDTIQYILDTIIPTGSSIEGMELKSNFINDVTNYATGEVNKLMNTLIEQRSDTKEPTATDKATKGEISLKELMDELYKLWQVSWFIDNDGYFRIEHEKFFYNGLSTGTSKTVGIDLTNSSKYVGEESGKFYIEDSQSYEGSEVEKIKSETITFPDQLTNDWLTRRNYIEYDVIQDITTKKEHSIIFLSTDIGAAINDSESLSDDGFFLFNCEPAVGNDLQIISKQKDYPNPLLLGYPNAAFSVKWLLNDYYKYGRPDKSGQLFMPDLQATWEVMGSLPIYMQKDIVFLLNNSDTIDINKYIRTYLIKSDGGRYNNDGNIEKIEHDLETDFVKVTLGYEL